MGYACPLIILAIILVGSDLSRASISQGGGKTNYPDKEAEVFIILDGAQLWEASRRNRIDEIDVTEWMPNAIDYKESQLILLLKAAERHRRHGDRLTEADKKDVARGIAKADSRRIYTEQQIPDRLGVSQETVSNWQISGHGKGPSEKQRSFG